MKRKELIKKLKPYWQKLELLQEKFYGEVYQIEKEMSKKTGIKDLEFFMCDNSYVGIGNTERTIRLIQAHELGKE